MVYGIIARGLSQVVGRGLKSVGQRYFKEFGRYDKRLHGQLFGKSGGAGFRHGRDAGLAITGAASSFGRGDDLDAPTFVPPTSRKKLQAYSRRGNKYGARRTKSSACRKCDRQSGFSKYRRR